MFKIIEYKPEVIINLENGLYQFDSETATGKTRLCELLREYNRAGLPVVAYSYTDWSLGLDLISVVNKFKPKVLMIDRYDMFIGEYSDFLESIQDEIIVMIDCKDMLPFGEYDKVCGIKFTPDKIEVYI